MAANFEEEIVDVKGEVESCDIDWEKIVHSVIDPLIERPEVVMIRCLPPRDKNHITILIVAEDTDTARLVGKRGVVANALRDVIGMATKVSGTNERVHIRFESFGQEEI